MTHCSHSTSPEARDFVRFCGNYGLSPDDLGRCFRASGKWYRVIGADPSSARFPILVEDMGGRIHRYTSVLVRGMLGHDE